MFEASVGRSRNFGPCRVERMVSGNLSLILLETAQWEEFDVFASEFLQRVGGALVSRADSAVDRVWTVRIRGEDFWLAFDDWHSHYELSARTDRGNTIVTTLAARFGVRD